MIANTQPLLGGEPRQLIAHVGEDHGFVIARRFWDRHLKVWDCFHAAKTSEIFSCCQKSEARVTAEHPGRLKGTTGDRFKTWICSSARDLALLAPCE